MARRVPDISWADIPGRVSRLSATPSYRAHRCVGCLRLQLRHEIAEPVKPAVHPDTCEVAVLCPKLCDMLDCHSLVLVIGEVVLSWQHSFHAGVCTREAPAEVEGLHDRVVKAVADAGGLGRLHKLPHHVVPDHSATGAHGIAVRAAVGQGRFRGPQAKATAVLGGEDSDAGAQAGDALHPLRRVQFPRIESSGVSSLSGCIWRMHVPVAGIAARVPVVRECAHIEVDESNEVR
mmetsp:Transcript_133863/g.373249  ORF Transcript_133863/g.373249 Transcript_133863/m.373249 type:complete len:234 (+) Transcript_133863:103-804(+)